MFDTEMTGGVPAFFPLIRPGCEEIAAKYFQCVETATKEKKEIGKNCDHKDYAQCTEKSLKTGPKTAVLTEYQKN